MVSEYFESCTLKSFQKSTKTNAEESLVILSQIYNALEYIHSNQIVHRDFNANNILIDNQSHVIKIIDFGLSKIMNSRNGMFSPQGNIWYRPPNTEELKNPFLRMYGTLPFLP